MCYPSALERGLGSLDLFDVFELSYTRVDADFMLRDFLVGELAVAKVILFRQWGLATQLRTLFGPLSLPGTSTCKKASMVALERVIGINEPQSSQQDDR